MTKFILRLFIIALIFSVHQSFGQAITQAQAAEMAKRIRTMTPQQIMKFRDSLMKAMTQHQARVMPNGNQLLLTHHYDTTYTTVSFNYTKKTIKNWKGISGTSTEVVIGKSLKAPMIYEANGHVSVQCSLNSIGGNTSILDREATAINNGVKYMTPEQATASTNTSRQMSYASISAHDNSLSGSANETSDFGGQYTHTSIRTTSLTNMVFAFMYDPVQNISFVGAGADINIHSVFTDNGQSDQRDESKFIGINATTDPSVAKMLGAGPISSNPNETYAVVTKTPRGYKISYTRLQHLNSSGTEITETLTAIIGAPEQKIEAFIVPAASVDDYHKWLPEGPDPKDEKTTGNNISFTVYTKDKTQPDQKITANIKSVTYTLTDVSHEPGYSMNYPSVKPGTKADLQLLAINEKPDPEIEKLNLTLNADQGRDVNVACFDYGAYGRITALVTLTDGTVLIAKDDKGQKNYATIPYCTHDDSKVADYWKELHKATGLKDDDDNETDDSLKNNTYKGDGFSLYEEYRGFIEKKIHIRTDPHKKDVMICDKVRDALATAANALPSGSVFEKAQKLALPGRSQDGIDMFAAVTGFITHSKFEPDEFGIDIGKNIYAGDRELDTINLPPFTHSKVLNLNTSGYASLHEQSGLLLLPSPKHLGYAAAFRKDHKSIMPPKVWYCLVITADFDPASKGYSTVTGDRDILNNQGVVAINPNGGAKIITDEYAVTVAHEMLHYCNVKHHGDLDEDKITFYVAPGYPSVYIVENSVSVPIKLFWDDLEVTPITPQDPIFKGVTRITVALKFQHGTNSGVEDCIMRYDTGRAYKGADGNYYLLLDWQKQYSELTGITLCKSKAGTGVNDPKHAPRPRYGDAANGNCQGQVCINDKYIK